MTEQLAHSSIQIAGIPAIWIAPRRTQLRQLVIWLPGFSGNKDAMLPYLHQLAERGFVALSFDPVGHGERLTESNEALRARVAGNIRRHFWPILASTAEEVSQVVDWAIDNLDVTPDVGIGGISMGGDIAVTAAGIDHRIVCVAAGIATADWLRPGSFEVPGEPDDVAQAAYDRRNPLTHLDTYRHCPAITFQCGAEDRQVPPDGAQRFVEALQGSYCSGLDRLDVTLRAGTGHRFSDEMWQGSLHWFQRFLLNGS